MKIEPVVWRRTARLIALYTCVVVLSAPFVSLAQTTSPDALVTDIRLFYDRLAPYGKWVTIEPHGRVWVPASTPSSWRPYTEGRWIYTEVGLTWVSEWAWGWATFHYGRWLFKMPYGWVWIPGTVWAPAWVAWQVGDAWVGWASLPTQVSWDPKVGLSAERLDLIDIEPSRYVFVPAPQLLEPDLKMVLEDPARNPFLLQQTQHVTDYVPVESGVHNRSLSVEQVALFAGHPVAQHNLQHLERDAPDLSTRIIGRDVIMFRPFIFKPGSGETLPSPEVSPSSIPPPPDETPRTPQRPERRALEARLRAERANLIERQRREFEVLAARGHTPEDIEQQHERERRVFEHYAERERQALEQRLKLKRQKPPLRLFYDEPGSLPWQSSYE